MSTVLCEGGCGQPAAVASQTSKRDGVVKGQPLRYTDGHRRGCPYTADQRIGILLARAEGVTVDLLFIQYPNVDRQALKALADDMGQVKAVYQAEFPDALDDQDDDQPPVEDEPVEVTDDEMPADLIAELQSKRRSGWSLAELYKVTKYAKYGREQIRAAVAGVPTDDETAPAADQPAAENKPAKPVKARPVKEPTAPKQPRDDGRAKNAIVSDDEVRRILEQIDAAADGKPDYAAIGESVGRSASCARNVGKNRVRLLARAGSR